MTDYRGSSSASWKHFLYLWLIVRMLQVPGWIHATALVIIVGQSGQCFRYHTTLNYPPRVDCKYLSPAQPASQPVSPLRSRRVSAGLLVINLGDML